MTGSSGEAGFVSVVLVVLFFALYRGWYTPEVVVSCFAWLLDVVATAAVLVLHTLYIRLSGERVLL